MERLGAKYRRRLAGIEPKASKKYPEDLAQKYAYMAGGLEILCLEVINRVEDLEDKLGKGE
jgi:hypothetical protein